MNEEMHNEIIEIGKRIWDELRDECDGSYVGELKKLKFENKGKEYDLAIDCYWSSSDYFDYKITGHGIDEQKLVACYM